MSVENKDFESPRIMVPTSDVLLIEMTTDRSLGSGKDAEETIRRYYAEQIRLLHSEFIGEADKSPEPTTHLSPKYGFSAMAAWKNAEGMIGSNHMYFWDEVFGHNAPFLSIDLSFQGGEEFYGELLNHAAHFWDPVNIRYKTLFDPYGFNVNTWQNLAPAIHRQRLALGLYAENGFEREKLDQFYRQLPAKLNMDSLYGPIYFGDQVAWGHWETSGWTGTIFPVADFSQGQTNSGNHQWTTLSEGQNGKDHTQGEVLDLKIYTCRPFEPDDALNFAVDQLRTEVFFSKSF